ncbi:MAG TPA: hypothetical protein VMR81_07045 [Patescibacteria group bacterium]|nr:hypothetical protein [Patescibacteria group bacterium]
MERKKNVIGVLVTFLVVLSAVVPFFGRSFIPTHDGEFHFIRFVEFNRMLREGYLFPRWAPTLNSGYGIPVFEFLYPFANYLAAFLHLFAIGFVDAFKIGSALGYLAAGLFCFLWLRKRFGLYPAVVGTIASSFVPYWFVELYVRGEIGEVWAIAWVFASLFVIEEDWPLPFTITISLLILSHNILAMLFFPFLIVYVLWRRNWKWLIAFIGGMGLAGWFWLPALAESKYMVGLNTVNFRDHFASVVQLLIPSWGTDFSGTGVSANAMSLQIGIGPMFWIVIAFITAIFISIKKKLKLELFGILAVMALAIGMTLPVSTPVWNALPILQYTQYPWRFLAYLIPMSAFVIACVSSVIKQRWITVIFVVLSIVSSFSYTRGAIYAPRNDQYYLSRQNFTNGTSSMGNSLSTIWTSWKQIRPSSMLTDTDGRSVPYETVNDKYLNKLYNVTTSFPESLRINLLYFPGWEVKVDGKSVPIHYISAGTLDFYVDAGVHSIQADMTETPMRKFADGISVISLVSIVGWGILQYIRKRTL